MAAAISSADTVAIAIVLNIAASVRISCPAGQGPVGIVIHGQGYGNNSTDSVRLKHIYGCYSLLYIIVNQPARSSLETGDRRAFYRVE
jgi:hypothetical protein